LGVIFALIIAAVGIGMHTESEIQTKTPLKLKGTSTEKGAKAPIIKTEDSSNQQKPPALPQPPSKVMEPVVDKATPKVPQPETQSQQSGPSDKPEKEYTLKVADPVASVKPANEKIPVKESESLGERPSIEEKPNNPPEVEIPSSPKPTTIELASAALEQNNYQTAIELLEADRNRDSESFIRAREIHSKALVGRAEQVALSSPLEAERMLRKAIEIDSKNIDAYQLLGKMYTRSKDYAMAIEAYQAAVTLDPKLSDAFFNLGYIYATSGMYDDAEKLFIRVVQLEPPYLDKALFNLAVIQEKLGKKEECMANLQMAVMIKPENEKAQTFLEQLLKAEEETQ
jgi:TolA-binding protein